MTSSSSSTSSSEYGRLERAPRTRLPAAAIGFVVVVLAIEGLLSSNRVAFADRAAWQWQIKKEQIERGTLAADVVVIGTSILFHSLDAWKVNQLTGASPTVANLALNGARLPHRVQILQRVVDSGAKPRVVVLELVSVDVEDSAWTSGPYWRFWADWSEFLESDCVWRDPELLFSFAANRFLTSFAYRRALDNWIFSCARAMGLDLTTLDRNRAVRDEMLSRLGFSRASEFENGLESEPDGEPRARPWTATRSGEAWLRRLLDLCVQEGIRVVICRPPCPPFVKRERERSGFYADFDRYLARLRGEYPSLDIGLFAPTGYATDDFADEHQHLSRKGGERLTAEFAEWIQRPENVPPERRDAR